MVYGSYEHVPISYGVVPFLPPKLQRRGLVFERKLVTMEREEWVTLVYGSYEHVPISYGVVTLLEANGYYRL